MAGLVGAGVVAFSLDTVVDSPSRWGVNYDYMFGNPYIEADEDIVAPVVGVAGVEALSAVHVGSLTIDEHETATLAIDPVKGGLLPTVLSGRAPSEPDEIGLGAEVARRLDVEIGSTVSVSGVTGESRDLRVVGIVVTPDSAGGGAVVPFDTFVDLNPTATRNVLFVRTEPDAGADVVDRISAANFSPPDAMPTPTSVWALRRVLPAPAVLALVLVVMLVVGCAYLLAMSVRARRRDLAVLRALGARRRQLRAAVHWQATVVTSLVLLFGAPLGVVLGRWVVSRLTDTLGIVPGVDIPLAALALTIVGALVAANLLALLPARGAARTATRMLNRDR
ncbi:MAG: ABC transporter permease [Actinobacteria bacterium]|nr:ABC transporter permease [Actinomycetota bacterium]